MVPTGDEAQVEARFGLSNIVLILTQDRCTVCDERTIGSEIDLDAPDGTPRGRGSGGAGFGLSDIVLILMQDRCTVCDEHTIGSEINLDAPDRTPR